MAREVLPFLPWDKPHLYLHDCLIGTCVDPPALPAEPDEDEEPV